MHAMFGLAVKYSEGNVKYLLKCLYTNILHCQWQFKCFVASWVNIHFTLLAIRHHFQSAG
jgi:hypothetical protein